MGAKLTAWGRWLRDQPRGTLTRAQKATDLAYSTLHYARVRRLTEVKHAEKLVAFSGGAFRVDEILRPSRRGGKRGAA